MSRAIVSGIWCLGCCEGMVYVNNVMGGVFGVLNGCYCGTRELCSLGTG